MMKRIDANAWETVPHKDGGWDLDLGGRDCLVDLHVVGTEEVLLSGIDLAGEVKGLDRGTILRLQAHVTGFRGLNLACAGSMTISCFFSDGAEIVDPTRLVVSEAVPVDPVRAAMGEQLRKILAQQEAERRLSDDEIEELVDDFVNPDLEFEDGMDDWGLPAAAAELEEEAAAARERAQEEFNAQREADLAEKDDASPGAPNAAEQPSKTEAKPKSAAAKPAKAGSKIAAEPGPGE